MDTRVTINSPSTPQGCDPDAAQETQVALSELMVSLRAEVPEALLLSMRLFIEEHPNWDQYRLFQAAVAGFLVQNGVQSRDVTRCYLAHLFPAQGRFRCG
ncbi:MAG: DUF2811 domain-containing protein [Cyanobacteria bacterium J06638_7]